MTVVGRVRATELPRERIASLVAALAVTSAAFGVGLVLADGPLAALGALGALTLALVVSLAQPHTATYVVIAILYSNAAAVAVRHHGLPEFAGLAFPVLLALPLADQLLMRRKPVMITAALPFLFGYLVVQVLAALAARDIPGTFDNLINFLISGFGLYFVLSNVLRTYSSLRSAVWIVLLVAAALGTLTSYQAVTKTYANNYWGFSTVELPGQEEELVASLQGTPRHAGPIGEQNRYGQIMLVLLPIGAALALGERTRFLRALALFLTFLILAGMATSFSRGAALGLLVVLGVGVMFRYVKPVHVVAMAIVLAMLLVTFPRYAERLADLQGLTSLDRLEGGAEVQGDSGNLRGRATATLAALYVWADHPLVGVGRGQFGHYYNEYAGVVAEAGVDTRIDPTKQVQAHNLFAAVAAETGALGFACFFAIFLITMRDLIRARRRWLLERPPVAHLAMGFFLALVAYLASGIALHLSYERYLWFLLALAGVAAHLALKGDETHDFEVRAPAAKRRAEAALPSAAR